MTCQTSFSGKIRKCFNMSADFFPKHGCQISTTFVVCFFLNKLSLGKTFICKVERLNVRSVDPDETAYYKPARLDLRCLQKNYCYRLWQ